MGSREGFYVAAHKEVGQTDFVLASSVADPYSNYKLVEFNMYGLHLSNNGATQKEGIIVIK